MFTAGCLIVNNNVLLTVKSAAPNGNPDSYNYGVLENTVLFGSSQCREAGAFDVLAASGVAAPFTKAKVVALKATFIDKLREINLRREYAVTFPNADDPTPQQLATYQMARTMANGLTGWDRSSLLLELSKLLQQVSAPTTLRGVAGLSVGDRLRIVDNLSGHSLTLGTCGTFASYTNASKVRYYLCKEWPSHHFVGDDLALVEKGPVGGNLKGNDFNVFAAACERRAGLLDAVYNHMVGMNKEELTAAQVKAIHLNEIGQRAGLSYAQRIELMSKVA